MTTLERATNAEPGRVATDKVVADVGLLAADLEQMLKATAGQTGQDLAQVRAKAEESLQAAKARMTELHDAALAKSSAAGRATDEYVRANPWQFIAIGAVAGLVLGMVAARGGRTNR